MDPYTCVKCNMNNEESPTGNNSKEWKKYALQESLVTPILENEESLSNEKSVANELMETIGWHLKKLPRRYVVDWARCEEEGHILSWVEYKHRSHKARAYPTLMISTGKLVDGYRLSLYTDKPFLLVVSFMGEKITEHRPIYQCEITSGMIRESDMRIGGRSDRGFGFDQEPVTYLPLKHFYPLNAYAIREPLK